MNFPFTAVLLKESHSVHVCRGEYENFDSRHSFHFIKDIVELRALFTDMANDRYVKHADDVHPVLVISTGSGAFEVSFSNEAESYRIGQEWGAQNVDLEDEIIDELHDIEATRLQERLAARFAAAQREKDEQFAEDQRRAEQQRKDEIAHFKELAQKFGVDIPDGVINP